MRRRNDDVSTPRVARGLLEALLPRADREFFIGDLEEEYRDRCRCTSPLSARLWFWREALAALGSGISVRPGTVPSQPISKGDPVMTSLWQDVRFSLRMFRKNAGFTTIAVLTLCLGIGANTAIFTIVNALLVSPLPFADLDRIVQVWEQAPTHGVERGNVAPGNFFDWRRQNGSLESLAAYRGWTANLAGGDIPERLQGSLVSADLFRVLDVRATQGRTFLSSEEVPGKDRVVLLSHGLWQRRFGGDPNTVGTVLTIGGIARTVIGIMPAEFNFPAGAEIWAPLAFTEAQGLDRGAYYLLAVGRLKKDVPLATAQVELAGIAQRLEREYPASNTGKGVLLVPITEETVRFYRPALLTLTGAVGFVLLIACANVANLLLARATGRRREIAVRRALGAGLWRIVRQTLTESVLVSLLGAALGIVLAWWGVGVMVAAFPGEFARVIPNWKHVEINPTVLAFTVLLAWGSGILFGLAPALHATKLDFNGALKEGGGSSGAAFGPNRMRSSLVVLEVAVSVLLLVGAGLTLRAFARFQNVDLGFDLRNVLLVRTTLPSAKYPDDAQITVFYTRLLERVAVLPGVQSASLANYPPLDDSNSMQGFLIEGQPEPAPGKIPFLNERAVSPEYFKTLRIPLIAGRTPDAHDIEGAARVVVVNEAFARRYWPSEKGIGRRIRKGGALAENPWLEVVGIIGDVRSRMDTPPQPEVYFPYQQDPWRSMSLVVRTAGEPFALAASVRAQVLTLDKEQPVFNVRTMESWRKQVVFIHNFSVYLMNIFAGIALLMAAVGMYGVMAYVVGQRVPEIGVRMALGARPSDVRRLVMAQGMKLSMVGLVVGLLLAVALSRALAGVLHDAGSVDALILGTVSVVLFSVSALACWLPAMRATRVDPLVALRRD